MITLCVLSICRLSSFIRSHRFDGKISSFSTAFKITAAIWIYSLSLSVPPLFGWGRYIPEVSGLGYVEVILHFLVDIIFHEFMHQIKNWYHNYLIYLNLDAPQIGIQNKEVTHTFYGSCYLVFCYLPCSYVSHLSSRASIYMR